ncbi:MAG: MaoC family dehydratase [Rudaea sp.]
MQVIENLDGLSQWVGREVACSGWMLVDQARIQRFADATDDHQWIHIDPARSRSESPYRAAVAHGLLTLSLLPALLESCMRIDGVAVAINYGFDRVRFPSPVLAGSRVRARVLLERLESVAGGVQAHWIATVEIEGSDKPACVAQMLARYLAARDDESLRRQR